MLIPEINDFVGAKQNADDATRTGELCCNSAAAQLLLLLFFFNQGSAPALQIQGNWISMLTDFHHPP